MKKDKDIVVIVGMTPMERVQARRILTTRYTLAIRKKQYQSAKIIKNLMEKLKQ